MVDYLVMIVLIVIAITIQLFGECFLSILLSPVKLLMQDALDLACGRTLWGHALMLASCMEDQSRTYVVNRFTASLSSTDPLSTFYTMLLGRTPSVVRVSP